MKEILNAVPDSIFPDCQQVTLYFSLLTFFNKTLNSVLMFSPQTLITFIPHNEKCLVSGGFVFQRNTFL